MDYYYDPTPAFLAQMAATDSLLFIATPRGHGLELWISDGTFEGSRRLAGGGKGPQWVSLDRMTPAGQQVFFVADDGIHGTESWVTDGTEAGTRMLKDINPGLTGGVAKERLSRLWARTSFSQPMTPSTAPSYG